MTEEQVANKLFELTQVATGVKLLTNHSKIQMGMLLDEAQELCSYAESEGYDFINTYNIILAELHLNVRRTVGMIRNARFIKKYEIDEPKWIYLDSSIIELFRKKNINPLDYWDDILTLSYTDLKELHG